MSTLKSKGYSPCNDVVDEAVDGVYANPAGAVNLPWVGGFLGTEATILLLLAQRFGAFGVAAKGDGSTRRFKFYYSRESTGNWFAEVWPMWKVSVWFVALIFHADKFYKLKSGAGALLVGVLLLAAFGLRSVLALRNSVVAGRLSGYSFARESFPMMLAGAVAGVIMIEWSFVLPWNVGGIAVAAEDIIYILGLPFGVMSVVYNILMIALTFAGFSVGSVMLYQSLAGGMVRGWLETAFANQLVLAEPEAGTWFHKLRTTGANPISGVVMFFLGVAAIGGMAMPFM